MAFFEPSSTFTRADDDKKKKALNDKVKQKYNDLRYTANMGTDKKAKKAYEKANKLKDKYDFSTVTWEGSGYIKNF